MTNPFAAPGQAPAQPAFQQPPAAPPQQYAQQPQGFAPQGYGAPAPQQPGGWQQMPQTAQEAQQYGAPAQPAAPAPQQTENTADFFGGAASISFADPSTKGQARGGVVLSKAVTQRTNMQTGQPEFWPNNQPKMQLAVTLQTAERADPQDDGKRTLFVKSHMVKAVKTALQTAGVPDLEVGGLLLVAWVDDKPSKTPGFGAAKIFAAQYQRAGSFDPAPYQQGQPGGPRIAPLPAAPAQPQAPAQQYQTTGTQNGQSVAFQQTQQPAPAQPQTGGFNPFG